MRQRIHDLNHFSIEDGAYLRKRARLLYSLRIPPKGKAMGRVSLSRTETPSENKMNYFIRQGVCLVAFLIHLSLFWGDGNAFLWAFAVFQSFVYPAILHFSPRFRMNAANNLLVDSSLYGICLALWGFNPYLVATFVASINIINMAAGGVVACVRGAVLMLMCALLTGFVTGFTYRAELPQTTMLFTAAGLVFFLTSLGMQIYKINTRLRTTRSDLQAERKELLNINTLALAVNSYLDVDIIMHSMMRTMECIYPFEALYIIAFEEEHQLLEVSGIYGSCISQEEHAAFRNFRFDIDKDRHSLFVKGLIRRKVINISDITPELVANGAQIDQDLFAVKPSVSLAYFPVFVNDKVVAGACFINYEKRFRLSDSDLDRIQQYLVQVGTAVRNATLIGELSKAKVQAEVAQQKAESSEEAKSRFLANMSHEIRTPLTAIMGYSETLQEENITHEEQQKFLGYILRSGKHLLSMINDILDISKIEAKKIEVERISCSLLEVLCDIDSYMQIKAKEKQLKYSFKVEYPIPEIVVTDPTRLKQILLNLCNNAAKFTEQGQVTLTMRVQQSKILQVEVEDTGIGISEAEQEKVFSAFDQADTSTTRLFGGTGLGLYISRNLAQLLGGDITLKSELDVGTTFYLNLPLDVRHCSYIRSDEEFIRHMTEVRESKTYSGVPQLSGRALIAEDNPENQALIMRLVKRTGMAVDLAENGQQAVEAAAKEQYNIILMDMQMPLIGGREAASMIRGSGNQTPIVAFTANVMKHHLDEYRDLGFDGVLEKPIVREKLFDTLKTLTKNTKLHRRKVLIVEDNEVNQIILSHHISKYYEAAEIMLANDGEAAIARIKQYDFDLVFMDMEMPVMGGLEATRQIRSLDHQMPIYIVSGNISSDDVRHCMSAGATGHIPKPFDKQQIMSVITSVLQ